MTAPKLNLVVLRCSDIARSAAFYGHLGMEFTLHRHGKGPEHQAAELAGGVFELYPSSQEGPSTLGTRIGFAVTSLDEVISSLSEYPGAVLSPPKESEWGRRAVLVDPDGHRVELLQSA